MRKKLKEMDGERLRFSAVVERFGERSGYAVETLPTILLKAVAIADTGEQVTNHLWFTRGKSWEPFSVGDTVEFDARVVAYEKGYKGRRHDVYDAPIKIDYKLERPTKVKLITEVS